MKLRFTRGTTPPTQCADLESTSSQYASKTSPAGITFTDDFTVGAWVKLESYGTSRTIVSRYDGTSGWVMRIGALGATDGRVQIMGINGGAANYSASVSLQAVPLGRWVHIAAVLDMSTFTTAASPIYIDGTSVAVAVVRGGTNPTALVQAGNLQVGAANSTDFFDGELDEVWIENTKLTQTQICDRMCQQFTPGAGTVGYWKLDGNFNDSSANANNLTASGGATATTVDNPMNAKEHAVIASVTSTTVTVQTGPNSMIPNMTLSSPVYSLMENPWGLPGGLGRNRVIGHALLGNTYSSSSTAVGQIPGLSVPVTVPTGRQVEITLFSRSIYNSSGFTYVITGIHDGTVSSATQVSLSTAYTATANQEFPHATMIVLSPSAGSHTFNASLRCDAGTAFITSDYASPAYLIVKLV